MPCGARQAESIAVPPVWSPPVAFRSAFRSVVGSREDVTMFELQWVLATGTVLGVLVALAASSIRGWNHRPGSVTFNGRVALPNATLQRGSYIFELAVASSDRDVVRVLSKDRSRVYWMAPTETVERPQTLSDDLVVAFGEARPGEAPPITVWYPQGRTVGHRFLYR